MRDKLINKIAEALRDDAVAVHKQIGYESDLPTVSKLNLYIKPAQIALDTLLGELEEPKEYAKALKDVWGCDGEEITTLRPSYKELYQQLLDMRK